MAFPLLSAQQIVSASTNIGPNPAAVEAIAVDPRGSETIFIGTISGGVQKSVDGGITWCAVNTGLTSLAVKALAIDASGPQTIYAGTAGGGLCHRIPRSGPDRPGVVYTAAFNNLSNGSIRKSIDRGLTWTTIFPTTAGIFEIRIDPSNPDILYARTIGHGAFKTRMAASTGPMPALTFALDPADSEILYAGTDANGIWKSTDAGDTWQHIGSPGTGDPRLKSLIVPAPQLPGW